MTSVYLFLICSLVLVLLSYAVPQQHTEESESLVWSDPMAAFRQPGWPGIGNYKFLSAVLFVLVVVIYVIF